MNLVTILNAVPPPMKQDTYFEVLALGFWDQTVWVQISTLSAMWPWA